MVLSLLVGAIAAYFAWLATRVSEEELDLARSEAARRAVLEIHMELLPLGYFDQTWQQLEAQEVHHKGPPPDNFLLIRIANKGKAVALDIAGQVDLDGMNFWVPQITGSSQITSVEVKPLLFTVNLNGVDRRLLPEPATADLQFIIPIKIIQGGTTRIPYAFSTSQGESAIGTYGLDIPPHHIPGSGKYVGPPWLDRAPPDWNNV